jgi:hypothetical protein
VGTAAEAILLRTRGALLSWIRSNAELSFRRNLLSNLRSACRLRQGLGILRSVIVALTKTGHAEVCKRPKQ